MIFSIESEQSLLYCIINKPSIISEVMVIVDVDMIYNQVNKSIFGALIKMFELDLKIDILTLKDYLHIHKIVKDYKFELFEKEYYGNFNRNYLEYARIIEEKYIKREIYLKSKILCNWCKFDEKNNDDIINFGIDFFSSLIKQEKKYINNTDLVMTYINDIKSGKIKIIPTGYSRLDSIIGGFAYGRYIILGARPKRGKTTMVVNFIYNQCIKLDVPIKFYSLEMKKEELLIRLIARALNINYEIVGKGDLNTEQYLAKIKFMEAFQDKPLVIEDDIYDLDKLIFDIRNSNEKLIYIDYNEKIFVKGANSLYESLVKISDSLSKLAKNTEKSIIMVQQLKDDFNENKKPSVSNLYMKVGEKDCSQLLLLHGSLEDNHREIIVDLNRYGNTGIVEFSFDGRVAKFEQKNKMIPDLPNYYGEKDAF